MIVRSALLAVGIFLLAAAAVTACFSAPFLVVVWLGGVGLALTVGILFERKRYKPAESVPPAADWVATDERFLDPDSGETVTVFYRPASGERRYIRS
jgi:hypothetical protein